jgi:hypothetical protein
MRVPGSVVVGVGPHAGAWLGGRGCRAPCGCLAWWLGSAPASSLSELLVGRSIPLGSCASSSRRPGRGRGPVVGGSPAVAGSGGGCSLVGFSVRWGGDQAAVGLAGQLPAALMDRPMMGPAHQGQIRQVGGAAVQPVDQMMGLAPGGRPLAAGHRAAAVADHQGGPLGGGHDPAGPADLQRLGRGPPRVTGSRVAAAWSWAARLPSPPGSS